MMEFSDQSVMVHSLRKSDDPEWRFVGWVFIILTSGHNQPI